MGKRNLFFLFLLLAMMFPAVGQTKDSDSGKLNLAAVKKVIKAKLLEVQKCYTDLIIEGMAKAGSVVVTWEIDDKGGVGNLMVKENTANDSALAGCVTEKMQTWTFPPAENGKIFAATYTFKFGN